MEGLIMDFSGIYEEQQFWKEKEAVWVNTRDIPGTNCYCDGDAMNEIRSRIRPYSGRGIHFIDSGNYHYMTRIWLEKISRPFNLLVFDNHTDMQPPAFGGLLSCGGWIYDSLMEISLLKKVILIGPDEEAFSRVEPEIREKVDFLSREKLLIMDEAEISDFVRAHVGKNPLYISIDKDVLNKEEADTNWSQGDMKLETMLQCLEAAVSECAGMTDTEQNVQEYILPGILGVDICGECDATEGGNSELNDRANDRLWKFFLSEEEKAYGNKTSGGDR